MEQISRRSFVAGLTSLAAASATGTFAAAEPPQRNGQTHMKLSLAAYSFNRFLSRPGRGQKGDMTLDDFVEFCAKLNLDGTELTSYYFPENVTNEYLLHLKEKTFRLGLDVSGTAIGNDFCLAPGEKRDAQIALCKTWIDHAAVMGAPVIRIFAGRIPKGETEDVALDRCVAGIDECLDYAATKGVFLALENHGGITATPDQLLAIVKRVKPSPWFGVNYDSGNFRTDALIVTWKKSLLTRSMLRSRWPSLAMGRRSLPTSIEWSRFSSWPNIVAMSCLSMKRRSRGTRFPNTSICSASLFPDCSRLNSDTHGRPD